MISSSAARALGFVLGGMLLVGGMAQAHPRAKGHVSVQTQVRLHPPFVTIAVWMEAPTAWERELYVERVGPLREADSQKLLRFRLDREQELMDSIDLRAERKSVFNAFKAAPLPSALKQSPGQSLYLVQAVLELGDVLVDGRLEVEVGLTLEPTREEWYSSRASAESGWTVLEDSFVDLVAEAEGLDRRGDEVWTADPQARRLRWVFTDR